MKRRNALRFLALTAGTLVTLPAWAKGWNESGLGHLLLKLTPDQELTLAEVVETLIPATDTPGAKALGVHQFVRKMVADCYGAKAQNTFASGFGLLDAFAEKSFGKAFTSCSNAQRTEMLLSIEKGQTGPLKDFYGLVKNLTIRGYLNAEYVMTNLLKYEFIPSRFHGCFPVAR